MTDEKLIELALEAGIEADMGELRWFYDKIAEATKEKAAKVCDERGHCNECGGGSEYAAAIRSME